MFYRRRSDRPLGGKLLQEITEASTRANSDNEEEEEEGEEPSSPSGEGKRLVDSSRNGSTSALAGVGAAHQAGVGGLRAGVRVRSVEIDSSDGEELPPYDQKHQQSSSRFSLIDQPAWSFDNIITAGPAVSDADDGGLFDDAEGGDDDDDDDDYDSNKAVGGGDMSDLDQQSVGDADADANVDVDVDVDASHETARYPSVVNAIGIVSDEDEDLPVVELRVNEDE